MTTAKDDPDQEHKSRAAQARPPEAETPTGLRKAADGMAEAQAWKGQQIAKGWRKFAAVLRRPKKEGRS